MHACLQPPDGASAPPKGLGPVTLRGVIWFIRHGETDWNVSGRLQGGRDTALNQRGRRQAQIAGAFLRSALDAAPQPAGLRWLASPLSRTRATMELVRETMGEQPHGYETDSRLQEMSFGRWEGRTWKEVRARNPAAHAARRADPWGFTPPGGESYAAVATRLAPLLQNLGDAVIVSHGGVARALLALACAMPPEEAARFPIWQGRVLRMAANDCRWLPEDMPPGHGDAAG